LRDDAVRVKDYLLNAEGWDANEFATVQFRIPKALSFHRFRIPKDLSFHRFFKCLTPQPPMIIMLLLERLLKEDGLVMRGRLNRSHRNE
jgi:hypothetical protein